MDGWDNLVVVSYFTENYSQEWRRLMRSVAKFGLASTYTMIGHADRELAWQEAVREKPQHILSAMNRNPGRPILFVDADAVFNRDPRTVDPGNGDVMIYGSMNRPQSGTVICSNTDHSKELIQDWIDEDAKQTNKRPQKVLRRVAVDITLDPRWCWIFDISPKRHPEIPPEEAIVVHLQASRELSPPDHPALLRRREEIKKWNPLTQ